ncbi:M14 family metallopeptidase [Spirobacillus cienkowskii]|uniref:M14 family metallopeptidase n=1 Tax=Spirobacillus cienkowskii TaxID=495820 RepID=UPI0030D392BD
MDDFLFSKQYLNYNEMLSEIENLCKKFPKNIFFEKIIIGKTIEQRDILAIRVYPQGQNCIQPTVWIDANMHATEFIGTNVVLAHIYNLIEKLHQKVKKFFTVNYIFVPRICPDGVEQYFTEGKRNRSNARDKRHSSEIGSHWNRCCLVKKPVRDNNVQFLKNPNRVGLMRKKNDAGIWTYDKKYPQLLRRKELGDTGPFYDIYPEGMIENYDGFNIPAANIVAENEVDLNRNFPVEWSPCYIENMSGKYPLSETESHSIVTFAAKIPQIYFWLNYHTFGGVYIRPPESQDDSCLSIGDRSVYLTIDKKLEEITGYPAVSGHKEFTYLPGKPLPGCLTSYSYHAHGAFSYVCELWDLPARIDRTERPFMMRYNNWNTKEWRSIFEYDQKFNNSILFGSEYLSYEHSQIGAVEIFDFPSAFGINNPPKQLIKDVIEKQLPVLELIVDLSPQIKIDAEIINKSSEHINFLHLTIANTGFLPTWISDAKTNAQGSKKIIIQITDTKNAEIIGENVFLLTELSGYLQLVNGWIHSPDNGTVHCTSKTIKIPFLALNKESDVEINIKVTFPNLGEYLKTVNFKL